MQGPKSLASLAPKRSNHTGFRGPKLRTETRLLPVEAGPTNSSL